VYQSWIKGNAHPNGWHKDLRVKFGAKTFCNMKKIGVLGAGHLGKIHLNCIAQIPGYELVGFYDPNPENAAAVAAERNLKAFDSVEALIDAVEVVDIVTPTLNHYDCAVQAFRKSRHVFIEKPITHTLEEAKQLLKLGQEAGVKAQVGHVERFNPAFKAAKPYLNNPLFIEAHRLAEFNPRGTDVPVVLDLMIHDIDMVLSIVKSNLKRVSASGVAVVSDTPDICNARLEFDNGAVANLTASRISMKKMRKARIFQRDAYVSIDYLTKETEIVRMKNLEAEPGPFDMVMDLPNGKRKQIYFEKPESANTNAIREELEELLKAIEENTTPPVTLYDGYLALDVAHQVMDKLNKSLKTLV
jgi:predicted dehydrogenase